MILNLFKKIFGLNNNNNINDTESNTNSSQAQLEASVPFKWRGSVEDAIFQASLVTSENQLKSLKLSIIKTFLINITFPSILSIIISIIICFANTAMQLVGIIILFFCLIFCTDLIMWLFNTLAKINKAYLMSSSTNQEEFSTSFQVIQVNRSSTRSIPTLTDSIILPPPIYQEARLYPPAYDFNKYTTRSSNNNNNRENMNTIESPRSLNFRIDISNREFTPSYHSTA